MPISISGSGVITGASSFASNTIFSGTVGVAGAVNTSSTLSVAGNFYSTGSIVQIQSYTYTGYWSTTSHGGAAGAGTNSPLAVAITPKFSTSKILIECSVMQSYNTSTTWLGRIVRTGSGLTTTNSPSTTNTYYSGWSYQSYLATSNAGMFPTAYLTWLDSPASSVATTYTLNIGGNNIGYTVGIGGGDNGAYSTYGSISVITAYELAQ
jgi:hypothetical protein